jgi:hypothetical protein
MAKLVFILHVPLFFVLLSVVRFMPITNVFRRLSLVTRTEIYLITGPLREEVGRSLLETVCIRVRLSESREAGDGRLKSPSPLQGTMLTSEPAVPVILIVAPGIAAIHIDMYAFEIASASMVVCAPCW